MQSQLDIQLHPRKVQLEESGKGIDFLGYIVRLNYTLVRQKVVRRLKNRLYHYEFGLSQEAIESSKDKQNFAKLQPAVSSYYGHFSHAQSYRLMKRTKQSRAWKDCRV